MTSYLKTTTALVLFILHLVLTPDSSALPMANLQEKETSSVEIRLISRKKRSIDYKPNGFDLELDAFDETHKLQLRSPSHPLFTKSFDYHELSTGAKGEFINTRKHISKRDLEDVEQHMYVDPKASASVRVKEVNGEIYIDGLVGRMRIRRDTSTGSHVARHTHISKNNETEITNDYVDNNRPIATGRGLPSKPITATVELCFILDYTNAKFFNFDDKKILEYVGPFVNTANYVFQAMKDPYITFQLSGVYAFKDLKSQPSKFTEKGKDGKVSLWSAWWQLETWAYENVNLPKHDVIVVLSSDQSAVGMELSNFRGACQIIPAQKKTKSIFFIPDTVGSMKGVKSFIHRLAHTLGASTDGDKLAPKCKDEGFLMSHKRMCGGLTKTFSECSRTQMREFIQSTGGHCLHQVGNVKSKVLPPLRPASTFEQQCEFYLGKGGFDLDKDYGKIPKYQCQSLVCMRAEAEDLTYPAEVEVRPPEGTPCGKGGKCKNEVCVEAG